MPREVRALTQKEVFMAGLRQAKSTEDVEDMQKLTGDTNTAAESGRVIHRHRVLVPLYKPTTFGVYIRKVVPEQNVDDLLTRRGWLVLCPDCGTDCGVDGINRCPARNALKFRRCPVCRKRIHDPGREVYGAVQETDTEDDEDEIKSDDLDRSSPETRTLVHMLKHMWTRHPDEARERGLPGLAAGLRDDDVTPGITRGVANLSQYPAPTGGEEGVP